MFHSDTQILYPSYVLPFKVYLLEDEENLVAVVSLHNLEIYWYGM
jgi:hypothetical protein